MRRRAARVLAGAVAVLILVGVYLCVRPIPTPVLRWALVWSAPLVLGDDRGIPDGVLDRTAHLVRRTWGNLLSFSLARAYDAARPLDASMGDVEFLMARLAPLRRLFVSQNELPHLPRDWMGFLAAVGYCDQLNRAGALVLADRFAHAQTYALATPDLRLGHVVGRVWSREFNDWLYFDLWPVNLVVFRYRDGVEMLGRTCDVPEQQVPEADSLARMLYDRIPSGTVLNEYPATFGAHLWSRRTRPADNIGAAASDDPLAIEAALRGLTASAAPAQDTAQPPAAAGAQASATGGAQASAATGGQAPDAGATQAATPAPALTAGEEPLAAVAVPDGPASTAVSRAFMRQRLLRLLEPDASVQPMSGPAPATSDDVLLQEASRLVASKLAVPPVACRPANR